MTSSRMDPKNIVANYRYFAFDLVSNTILAEIPFKNVSYGRAIREAGKFSGEIPVIDDTYNLSLYENTLPGRTAIYVVRNGVCVWGGIIWARDYNIKDRILSVNADEFTSYLHKRVAWKTWDNDYQASINVVRSGSTSTATVTLAGENFNFSVGMPIFVSFGLEDNYKYNGYYTIASLDGSTPTSKFTFSCNNIPTSRYDEVSTISLREDTYQYTRDFLSALDNDFFGIRFPNTVIEPAQEYLLTLATLARTSNVATVTTTTAHDVVIGQRITIKDVLANSSFEGVYTVKSTPNSYTITYDNPGSNVSTTSVSSSTKTVTSISRTKNTDVNGGYIGLMTIYAASHGFVSGNVVYLNGVLGSVDGYQKILTTPTSGTFTINSYPYTTPIAASAVTGGTATVGPSLRFSSYGEFTKNSPMNLGYSSTAFSGEPPGINIRHRGSELKTIGEILDSYSDRPTGFDYRIDCTYNATTGSFDKTFVFIPITPESLSLYVNSLPGQVLPTGQVAPASAFGADSIVFEYPGNITDATLNESAEDSATRFWVQGKDDTGVAEASLPYAAESAFDLLDPSQSRPWPLIERVETYDSSEEDILYMYATRYLGQVRPPLGNFSVAINGSLIPEIGTYKPGDWCSVIIQDNFVQLRLDNVSEVDGIRGFLLRKIDTISVTVPDNPSFPESVTVNLIAEPKVDVVGN